jgi:hypothetical protein
MASAKPSHCAQLFRRGTALVPAISAGSGERGHAKTFRPFCELASWFANYLQFVIFKP